MLSTTGDTTWGVADQITGGTGSTLNLTAVLGGNIGTTGRTTNGVENFNITLADDNTTANHTLTIDASTLNGAKAFTIASATASTNDAIVFNNLAKSQTVTIKSTDTDLDVKLNFKSGEDSGAADTATVAVNAAKADTVTIAGAFETVAVNGTGTSTVATLNASGNAMTKLTVGGEGATLNSVTGWSTTATALAIDASAATGDVTVGTALSSKFTSVKGGTGTNDTLIGTGASTTISSAFKSEGFENVLFTGTGNSIDLTNSTGVTTVGTRGVTTGTTTFNNIAAASTLQLQGAKTAANQTIGNLTATVKGATSSSPAASLTVKVNNQGMDTGATGSTEHTISVGTVTTNNVKAIAVEVADGDASMTLSADKLETLTLKASEDLVLNSTVGAAATTTSIDASQVAGKAKFTLVGNLVKDVTVTTGAGKDDVTLGDQAGANTAETTITINTGEGNDTFTTGAVTQKVTLKVDLGAGDDTVVVTNNKAISTAKDHSIAFGDGSDTLSFAGSTATDLSTVAMTGLDKVVLTGSANLSVQAASFSGQTTEISTFGSLLNLKGTDSSDTIDASKLVIVGPKGVGIEGGDAADTITGSAGADVINAGAGADALTGGAGADALTGGAGADSFVYAAVANSAASVSANTTVTFDTISDFATTSDKINLAAINTALTGAGAATGITVTTLTTGAASLNDTTLATLPN